MVLIHCFANKENKVNKTKKDYVDNIQIGNIIAFKVGEDMYSGKVIDISIYSEGVFQYTVKTKNGSVYFPSVDDITWIKNGSHWPVGIYNALKLTKTK